jgi:hypothetical protein
MAGIKETQELIVGLAALAHAVVAQVKDGVQFSDAAELIQKVLLDPVLSAKLTAAFQGVGQVPVEAADLSWFEGLMLGKLVLSEVKEVASASI